MNMNAYNCFIRSIAFKESEKEVIILNNFYICVIMFIIGGKL